MIVTEHVTGCLAERLPDSGSAGAGYQEAGPAGKKNKAPGILSAGCRVHQHHN